MKKLAAALLAAALLVLPAQAVSGAPTVDAAAAVLMEKETGAILYEQNAHDKLEPASVTKVMTLLLTMEAMDAGQLHYDDVVTASAHACSMGGSQIWLKENEQMTVSDMLKAVCVVSANDCAVALAETVAGSEEAFVERMNQRAAEFGMADTHFCNATGLPAEGHVTSAYDIALMSRELIRNHPDIRQYTTIWMDSLRDGASSLVNTNRLIRFYQGATGLKTGSTDSALYCLSGTAERDGMELIAVIMKAPTSTQRFEELRLFHLHAGEWGAGVRPAAGARVPGDPGHSAAGAGGEHAPPAGKGQGGQPAAAGHPGGLCGGAGGGGQSTGDPHHHLRGRGRGGAAHPGRRGDPTGHLRPDAGPDAADGLPLRLTAAGAAPPEIPADCDRFPLCPVSGHGIIKQQTRAALRKRGRS